MISYRPGDASFTECTEMDEKQRKGLAYIREHVLQRFGTTGIQQCIDTAVFDLLNLIAVYPVEDEHKLCDKNGNVLPDVFLVPKGSTVIDMAAKVHSDLAEVVSAANAERPDLVFLTGDLISSDWREALEVLDDLGLLEARLGVLGVFGNHDYHGRLETRISGAYAEQAAEDTGEEAGS